eukprot:gene5987-6683_t
MGLNQIARISSAKPVIFAEGFFISCYLQNEKFVPEEGIKKKDILSIINGEFFKSGTDFVEDFALECKLNELPSSEPVKRKPRENQYELEQFPLAAQIKYILTPEDMRIPIDPQEVVDGIALMHISSLDEVNSRSIEQRKEFEKQVVWTMEEGDDFVNTEIFTEVSEALLLLDVLNQYNVPSVGEHGGVGVKQRQGMEVEWVDDIV